MTIDGNFKSKSFFCTKPWTSFEIDHKGNVRPCCWSTLVCGNINSSSMEEIWNGPAYQDIRYFMRKGQLEPICAIDCPYRVGEHKNLAYSAPVSDIFRKNKKIQLKELEERKVVLQSKPTIMSIVPSIKCNKRCKMCYLDPHDTVDLPSNISDVIYSYFPTLQEIWITGGEPLISSECIDLIEKIDNKKFPDLHLGLITNGTVISDYIVHLLSNIRISWILVSVDAATEKTYRKVRGGDMKEVIKNIRVLKSIRNKQGSNWILKIGFIVMRSNIDELKDFVDLALKLGVDFQFSPVFGNNCESYYDDILLVKRTRTKLIELGEYLDKLGIGSIKIARVLAKIDAILSRSRSVKGKDFFMFFDGDEPMSYDMWEENIKYLYTMEYLGGGDENTHRNC